ncbi:MAG: hypothetical protein KMY54_03900 [Erysipelothrix sp.]|nr:hypothetical protein [Erysipelothrix sp.]
MSKENQAILQVLSKYNNVAKKLDIIKCVEESSIDDYVVLWNFLHGTYANNNRMIDLVDKMIDEYFNDNRERKKPNINSKNPLDHFPFNFKEIFSDYDRLIKRLDFSVEYYLPKLEMAKKRIFKSTGIFGAPVSTSEVEEFIALIDELGDFRSDIFRYLAICYLIRKLLDSLSVRELKRILEYSGIYMEYLPGINRARYYDNLYMTLLLFSR